MAAFVMQYTDSVGSDQPTATYSYTDKDGKLLFQALR